MPKKVIIIGSGISSLSAACFLGVKDMTLPLLKKMIQLVAERENSMPMVLRLIWDLVGIGCRKYSKTFTISSDIRPLISTT